MKRILVLGGFGFIGTNILKYIDEVYQKKYKCIVFDRSLNHIYGESFHSVERVYSGELSDILLLEKIFKENKIDLIIHSISTTVPVESTNARYDVETNLIPTLDILELMIKYNVFDIVYLSSGGAIYGSSNKSKHSEYEDVYPISSYGVVKLSIEKYLMQYAKQYGLKPLILRLSNPYGLFHYSKKQGFINIALYKALNHEEIQIWGDGNGRKDYIYVDDFVKIMFILLSKNIYNEIVNVGSGVLLSVNDILNEVAGIVPDIRISHINANKFDVLDFELDTSKLRNLIGDYNFIPFEDGLIRTLNWTRNRCC